MEELRKIHQAIIFQLALRPNIMLVTWQLQATAKTLEEIYQQCPWSMQIFGCDSSTPHNILFPPAGVACLWKFQGIFPQRGMRVHIDCIQVESVTGVQGKWQPWCVRMRCGSHGILGRSPWGWEESLSRVHREGGENLSSVAALKMLRMAGFRCWKKFMITIFPSKGQES